MKTISTLLLNLFFTPFLFAQQIDILTTFGDVEQDVANEIVITSDNNIFIIGESQNPVLLDKDYFIIELDENVITINSFIDQNNQDQIGEDLILLDNNRKVILGTAKNIHNRNSIEIKMVDSDNNEIWTNQYGPINPTYGPNSTSEATKMLNVNNQYFFVLSHLITGSGIYMFLIDLNGEIIWDKSVMEEEFRYKPSSAIKLQNGNFLISGTKSTADSENFEGYLMQINFEGNVIWEKTIQISEADIFYKIRELEDQSIVISCTSFLSQNDDMNVSLIKLDKNGDLLFAKYYSPDFNYLSAVDLDINSEGIIFILCHSFVNNGDIVLITVDGDGNEINRNLYGGQGEDRAKSILIDDNNKIHIIGYTDSYGVGKRDMLYLRLIDETLTPNSILQKINEEFSVYPNPISSFATINNSQNYIEFKLFDFDGKEVKTFKHQENFNVNNLSPGIYWLKGLHDNGTILVKKIIILN